jgi:hypothetical protein
VPSWLGISSENAAHRIAVEWDHGGTVCRGVYIRRRDTNSRFNVLAGGRLFPGEHHRAEFCVNETSDRFSVTLRSHDGETNMSIRARRADSLSASSVFGSLEDASDFFQGGSLGFSPTRDPHGFQGLELRCPHWKIEPLEVDALKSSFFDDETRFPRNSIRFDCALLMRGIQHEWRCRPDLCCAGGNAANVNSEIPTRR